MRSDQIVLAKQLSQIPGADAPTLGEISRLTPSMYDYASITAAIVPNAWHPKVVRWTTGREEEDVFPTFYRCNSKRRVEQLAARHRLNIETFEYLNQYQAYLVFNRALFWLGCMYEKVLANSEFFGPLRGWILCILEKKAGPDFAGGIKHGWSDEFNCTGGCKKVDDERQGSQDRVRITGQNTSGRHSAD